MRDRTDGVSEGVPGVYLTDDGRLVLYEEDNPEAYIRSDLIVDVER